MFSVDDSNIKVSSRSNIKSQIRPNNGGWKSGEKDENPWVKIILPDDFSRGGSIILPQMNNVKSIRVFTGTDSNGFQNEILVCIMTLLPIIPFVIFKLFFKNVTDKSVYKIYFPITLLLVKLIKQYTNYSFLFTSIFILLILAVDKRIPKPMLF